jgi:hypothetical protein
MKYIQMLISAVVKYLEDDAAQAQKDFEENGGVGGWSG